MMTDISVEIAEIAGLFAADGSMQKSHICFWGNPKADKDFYDNYIKLLFLKAFDIQIRPHEKKSNFVYGFYICNKNIISFFNKILGFPFGSKTYSVEVPTIIFNNSDKKILSAFLRGFFSGDGCLNFDKRYGNGYRKILTILHTYPRVQINCVCRNLIFQLSEMLDKLEISNFVSRKTSKKGNEVESFMLQVSGKERLERWVKEIGFPNKNHYSRYQIFKKYGFVPPNTTMEQRIRILRDELDLISFYKEISGPEGIRTLDLQSEVQLLSSRPQQIEGSAV